MFLVNYVLLRLCHFEKIGGTRRTDRQTDGDGATLIAASSEGRVKTTKMNLACLMFLGFKVWKKTVYPSLQQLTGLDYLQ